ncbi:hypothetical protein L0128_12840 [candidate division KSB1 bacterium]|nr:hypothetical protein [candidate division KSB1 bacterium]
MNFPNIRPGLHMVLLLGIICLPFSQEFVHAQAACPAIITIDALADSLDIFLDELFWGVTPLPPRSIPPGTHLLKARPHHRTLWRRDDWTVKFQINAAESLHFTIPKLGQYWVNSTPFDASVSYQDSILGATPIFISLPLAVAPVIRITKSGYQDYTLQLDEKIPVYQIQLQPVSESRAVMTSPLPSKARPKLTFRKKLARAALCTSILSGLTTIYLREAADEQYQRYLNTGDPDQMEKFYNQSRHLDTLTGISYTVFQINFVTSLYLLLFNP